VNVSWLRSGLIGLVLLAAGPGGIDAQSKTQSVVLDSVKISPLLSRQLTGDRPLPVRILSTAGTIDGSNWPTSLEWITRQDAGYATGSLRPDEIQALARDPAVRAIELIRVPSPELRQPGLDLGLNGVLALRSAFPGLQGAGQLLSIKEYSFDSTDVDLRGRYVITSLTPSFVDQHATNMACIAAGGGTSDPTAYGVARGAMVTSSDFRQLIPDPDAYFSQNAIATQNHSYGTGIENYYGMESAAYDAQAIQERNLLHVFSSGNAGEGAPEDGRYAGISGVANLTGQFKQAKNLLVVGGTDSLGQRLPFSSVGPAYDGRIKPDLVAYGQGGTSGAAAIVSGTSLLVREAFREARDSFPDAQVLRGILLHTARDLGRPGPDYEYGFGALQAFAAVSMAYTGHIMSIPASDDPVEIPVPVPDDTRRLKVTIHWSDPPAEILSGKALRHDLDLQVTHTPSGVTFLPLVTSSFPDLDSLTTNARPGIDTLNTTEQVIIDHPEPGEYRIRIDRSKVLSGEQSVTCLYTVEPGNDLTWLFPNHSDAVLPGGPVRVRWNGSMEGFARLEARHQLATDWVLVDPSVPLSAGYGSWRVPGVNGWAQLRLVTPDSVFESDTFLVASPPFLTVDLNCPDHAGLRWRAEPGADGYTVYRIGERYLEPYAITIDTFFNDYFPDPAFPYYALTATYADRTGPRTPGYHIGLQGVGCYLDQFYLVSQSGDQALFGAGLSRAGEVDEVILQRLRGASWTEEARMNPGGSSPIQIQSQPLETGGTDFRLLVLPAQGDTVISDPIRVWYVPTHDILVFPNPAGQGNPIHVLLPGTDDAVIEVFDSAGRRVLAMEHGDYPDLLPFRPPAAGIYFVMVRFSDGTRKVARLAAGH